MEKFTTIGHVDFYRLPKEQINSVEIGAYPRTAIIMDEQEVLQHKELLIKWSESNLVLLVVVTNQLNTIVPYFISKNILLFVADSFSEATHYAILSNRMLNNVICTCNQGFTFDFSNIEEL